MKTTLRKALLKNTLRRAVTDRAERTGLSECVLAAFRHLQQRQVAQRFMKLCNRRQSYIRLHFDKPDRYKSATNIFELRGPLALNLKMLRRWFDGEC